MASPFGEGQGPDEGAAPLSSQPLCLDPDGPSFPVDAPVVWLPSLDMPPPPPAHSPLPAGDALLAPLPAALHPAGMAQQQDQQQQQDGIAHFGLADEAAAPDLFLPLPLEPGPVSQQDADTFAALFGEAGLLPAPPPVLQQPQQPMQHPGGAQHAMDLQQPQQQQLQQPAAAREQMQAAASEHWQKQRQPAPRPAARSRSTSKQRQRRGRRAAGGGDSDGSWKSGGEEAEAEDEEESEDEEQASAEAKKAARKERVRAKNRRAQARYRQKQKDLRAQQERQVEQAQADLERERQANQRLREEGDALEQIASFKDLSLSSLEAAGCSLEAPAPSAGADTSDRAAPGADAARGSAGLELAARQGGAGGLGSSLGLWGSGSSARAAGAAGSSQTDDASTAAGSAARAASSSGSLAMPPPQQAQQQQGIPASSASASAASASIGSGGGATSSGSGASGLRQLPFEQRAWQVVSAVCPGIAAAAESLAAGGGLLAEDADDTGDSAAVAAVEAAMAASRTSSGAGAGSSPGSANEALWQVLRDEVMRMEEAEFIQDWADFGDLAASVLAEVDAGRLGEAAALARLKPAVTFRALLHSLMLHHRPDMYRRLLAHTRCPDDTEEVATARWRRAAAALGCTRSQAVQLRRRYDSYLASMARHSAESAASVAALSALAAEAPPAAGGAGEGGAFLAGRSLRSMVQQYLQLFEATQRMSRQPDAMLAALLEFHSAIGRELGDLQKARGAAMYRPLFPDVVAIIRACLDQHSLLPDLPPPT